METKKDDACFCGSGRHHSDCCLKNNGLSDKAETHGQDPTDTSPSYNAIAHGVYVDSIKRLIQGFGGRYLTPEYTNFAYNLCDKVSLTPELDIYRGKKTIWAAAIIHVIARLNSLFETGAEIVLTPALICAHFDTVKSTVGNRATQIQKTCNIKPGAKNYCHEKKEGVQLKLFNEEREQ